MIFVTSSGNLRCFHFFYLDFFYCYYKSHAGQEIVSFVDFFSSKHEAFKHFFFLKPFSVQQIGPFETTSAELRELRTGRPYMVQVCAQELLGLGECSEWSEAVNVTIPKVKL